MSENQTVRDQSVQRLVEEGYSIVIDGNYLIVENVPYVTSAGEVSYGALISAYREVDGVGMVDGNHTVWFTGSVPCTAEGDSLAAVMVADTNPLMIAGRQVKCRLSNKPDPIGDMLDNFYNKFTHYVRKLSTYARAVDPSASATGTGSLTTKIKPSVFYYPNMSVAQSGLDAYEDKLRVPKIVVIGAGGTGSYLLDALAKAPIERIDIYDGDIIEPKNAFRMPSALSIEQAHSEINKALFLADIYGAMRAGVTGYPSRIDSSNLHVLNGANFVFIAVDDGPSRRLIAEYLVGVGIPFIDVGIGVDVIQETVELTARARVTLITPETKELLAELPTSEDSQEDVYDNIQIVELNALNAMLAVVRFKQYIGFYTDEKKPSFVKYVVSWSSLILRNLAEDEI